MQHQRFQKARTRLRVLLADTSPSISARLNRVLTDIPGVLVVGQANCASTAMSLISESSPDAVILDVALTFGEGRSVLEFLRQCKPHIKIIVFSEYAPIIAHSTSLSPGVHAFFDRPLEFEAMRDLVVSLSLSPEANSFPGNADTDSQSDTNFVTRTS